MDVKVENLGPCHKKVAVTLPVEKVREEFDRQFREINDSIVYPGFRKGHAPRDLIQKRFGETLSREVKEKLVQGAMEQLLEDKKVDPLQAPDLDLETLEVKEEEPFAFDFEVLTKPEFETPAFKGLELDVPPISVSDEDVDAAISRLRESEARLETVEDAEVEEGDVLVVAWKAKEGDSVVLHDDNAYTVAGRGVVGGFVTEKVDAGLRGQKTGATASDRVEVAADDPREELRGRTLDLEVTLKEIQRRVLPEIDAAFLEKHDYDDESEMRDDARKQLERAAERERDRATEARLLDRLIDGVEISLPEAFVEDELANWARRQRSALEMEGVEPEQIEKRIDAERKDAKKAVETDLRRFFLLDRIADDEDIRVAEKEILQVIQEIAQVYRRPETEVLASYRDGGRLAELATQIRHRKVREAIRRAAKLVESEAAPAAEPQKQK